MAGESISIPIVTPGADLAARNIKQVGNASAETAGKLDVAAASLELWNVTAAKSAKADSTLIASRKAHAKADALAADAERVLAGEATKTTRLFADQRAKVDDSARSAAGAASRFGALAGTGGIPGGGMGAAIAAGVALSPALVTVGFGLAGVAAAAVGVAKPIENAASKTGGLQKNMNLLDAEQQTVARGILGLGRDFGTFQASMKPEILGIFSTGLRLASHLLHDVQPVAVATGAALDQVLGSVDREFQSGTWQNFFGWMAKNAGPDVNLLGQSFVNLLDTLPPLLRELQPLSHGLLQVTADTTKATDGVTRFIGAAEQRFPLSTENTFKFLRNLDSATIDLTNHIPGARAVNNWLTNLQLTLTGTGSVADAAVPRVQHATQALGDMMKTTVTTVSPMDRLGRATASASFSISEYGKNANLTVSPADRLGKASDVSAAAVGKVATAADFASQKVIDVRNSVRDLTTSLSKGLDPLLAYSGALITQRDDAKSLATALHASGDRVGLNTAAQRASFGAANTYIQDLETTAQKALASHRGIDTQITSLRNSLPMLRNVQGGTRLYWQEVQTLIRYLDRLRAERAIRESVTVFGAGTWSLSQKGGKLAGPLGAAAGWLVSGGTPGKDSVPIMAMPGELVVPRPMVSAGAVDHLRGSIPGFAAGGIVGSYRGNVAGLPPWVGHNQAVVQREIASAMAAAVWAGIKAARSSALAAATSFRDSGARSGSAAAAQAYARFLLPAYGWGQSQMSSLIPLWNQESGWNAYAVNPSSGAYGIPQSLGHGHPYNLGDYKAQVAWGEQYIKSRYGSPAAAWAHERAFNWYGNGLHAVVDRPTLIGVGERGRERVDVTPMVVPNRSTGGAVKLQLEWVGGNAGDGLLNWIQKNVRIRGGGDVQKAFGFRT